MKEYAVTWHIDIEAESPEEAARQAMETQRDPESTATVFLVGGQEIDVAGTQEKKYTVLGFWYDDEPVSTGVIAGDHPVWCGNVMGLGDSCFQGEWAMTVTAASPDEAEAEALKQIAEENEEEEESEWRSR